MMIAPVPTLILLVCNLLLQTVIIFYKEDVLKNIFIAFALFPVVSMAYADNSFYCVQVSTTINLEHAINTYQELKTSEGARIEKIDNAYVVRIGASQNRVKSVSLLKQIKSRYPGAYTRTCIKDSNRIIRGNILVHQKKEGADQSNRSGQSIQKKKKGNQPPPPGHSAQKKEMGDQPPLAGHKTVKTEERPLQPYPNPPVDVIDNKKTEVTKTSAINVEDYFKTGMQNYQDRKYDSAIGALSQYVSLSPKGNQCASALLVIGKSFEEKNNPRSALRIFSRIIEQYPNSPEALLSIIAMANIGVVNSAIKYPICWQGAEYFRDPLYAYDTVLVKNLPEQMIEHVQYQKGRYLWKMNRYRECCDTYTTLLNKYPNTAYRKEIIGTLKAGTVNLIDQYHQSGDYVSAANLFFQAKKKALIGADDVDIMMKLALSFAHLGLYDISSNILNTLKTNIKSKISADIEKTAAEIENIKIASAPSQLSADTKWQLFQSGQEYLNSNNLPLAEQTLSQLKNTGGEGFWSKITEYALEDNKWTQKYRGYFGKK